jgi:hypothetical protein
MPFLRTYARVLALLAPVEGLAGELIAEGGVFAALAKAQFLNREREPAVP